MIAYIITKDGRKYYSHVYAMLYSGYDTVAITYDNESRVFDYVNMYNTKPFIRRKVFIVDVRTDDWILFDGKLKKSYKDNMPPRGCKWLIDNIDLFSKIKSGKEIDEEYHIKAFEENKSIEINEWIDVKDERDIDSLLAFTQKFHDSMITSITKDNDSITVSFNSIWGAYPTLVFEGDVSSQYTDEYDNIELYRANIVFSDGYIYWVDDNLNDMSLLNADYMFFKSKTLKWKIEIVD